MKIKSTQKWLANCSRYLLGALCGLFLMMYGLPDAMAQDVTVSGKVTSAEDGGTLPGVNVIVKGTTQGTVTDIEGNYRISVPSNADTLSFSFIGLQSKDVAINGQSTINLQLSSDTQQLSEVVVTALGIERNKNELPYAAQKVEGEQVSQTRDPNFVNALSGRVAGLNVKQNNSLGGSTNIVIRGAKSLTGNNQALFVIDGVPVDNSNSNASSSSTGRGGENQSTGRGGYDYGNAAADINPDDIASINVLKGAAATALYGSRAANGVVIITTKKGNKNQGIGLTVNTGVTVGLIDKSTFASYQKSYGGGYGQYYESDDGFFLSRDINGDGTPDLVVPTSEDASYGGAFDPSLMVYQWDAFDPSSPYYQKARPWVAAANDPSTFFQNSVSSNHSAFIDGGNDKGSFKLGYTRTDQKGILPNSKISKNLVNFAATYDVTKKLTANASVNFSNVEGLGRYGTGYDSKNVAGNFRQWWQTNVDISELKDAYYRTNKNVTWNWADPSDLVPIYWDNPYWTRYENYENDNRIRYFGYMSLNYKFTDWLSLMGRISMDTYNEQQEERIAVGSVDVPEYSRYNRRYSEYNYDLLLNFNKDLSENFNLKALLGTNIRKTLSESIYAETNGGLVVPELYSLSNSVNPLEPPIETYAPLEVDGVFASVTLGYKDFLFLDVTGRRDQASSLPVDNNVYYYPSVSGSWIFSKLLDTNLPWLTYGKLRANYAEVGNTAPAQSILDTYDLNTGFNGIPMVSVNPTKNNENLKSERTKSYELGLEMAFFENRAGFDFSFYNTNTVDQILPVAVSRATGYDYKYINAGDVQNRGVEVSLFGTPVKTSDFSWTINVNWARNRNLVKDLGEIQNLLLGSFQGGVTINATKGQPYGTIKGTDFVYNEKNQKVVGENGLYEQSITSNEVIGNANPDWTGGVSNTFKYKNLSLGFLIDVQHGGDVFSLDMYYGLATGMYPETAGLNDLGNPLRDPVKTDESGNVINDPSNGGLILPGVKEDGTPNDVRVSATNFGLQGYRRNPAAAFVYDASYVKLRQLNLTYSLPQSVVDNLWVFNGIDVSLVGRNLWIIHKNLPYADPEENLSSGNIQGYQGGAYPTTRNIGFNIRLKL